MERPRPTGFPATRLVLAFVVLASGATASEPAKPAIDALDEGRGSATQKRRKQGRIAQAMAHVTITPSPVDDWFDILPQGMV